MNNPNSKTNRLKRNLVERWSAEDYPGANPRFQVNLFAKDFGIFIMLPIFAVILFKSCEGNSSASGKRNVVRQIKQQSNTAQSNSQIIDFNGNSRSKNAGVMSGGQRISGISKRAPGALVKVKLLNVVETYTTVPVHAQIIDAGLGQTLMGGTLIGDANPDPAYERITVSFKFARDPNRENVAVAINARALSLDGTLGLVANKKEGFFARSTYNSASGSAQEAMGRMGGTVDFKEILFRALTAGMVQEFGVGAQVERNRAHVLTLAPSTEFFAELTDFFPGGSK